MKKEKTKPTKAEESVAPPVEPTTMRIRILRTIRGSRHGSFAAGQTAELPTALARAWITEGLAEQDKMLEGAPESK